jgi:6-pyruvoyltetrahydropterin/6-carboxytetrahydropterin synthase
MYRLRVFDYFSSAHFLNGYSGKCESLHGHNWKVELEVEGDKLDSVGMLIDFKILKELLSSVITKMDHCLLNDLEPFRDMNPSAEHISKYIYKEIEKLLPAGVDISCISVWESDRSQAVYTEK